MANIQARLRNVFNLQHIDLGDSPALGYEGGGSRIQLADNDPMRPTYAVSINNFVPPGANPTQIIEMVGAANTITRLRMVQLSGSATSAKNLSFGLFRRSSAVTGSTPVAQTIGVRDTNDAAPVTIIRTLTVTAPSGGGATPKQFDGSRLNIAPASNGSIDRATFSYGWQNDKSPVLRSGEFFTLDLLNGDAWPSGGVLDVSIVFSEEAA